MGTNGWIHRHGLRRRPVFRRPRLCCSERHLRFVRRTYPGGRPGGHSMRLTSTHARHAKGFTLIETDRKSTRLNSSHQIISYAVFCLKKKKNTNRIHEP